MLGMPRFLFPSRPPMIRADCSWNAVSDVSSGRLDRHHIRLEWRWARACAGNFHMDTCLRRFGNGKGNVQHVIGNFGRHSMGSTVNDGLSEVMDSHASHPREGPGGSKGRPLYISLQVQHGLLFLTVPANLGTPAPEIGVSGAQ